MKILIFAFFSILPLLGFSQTSEIEVNVPITNVFVPTGFDSNDEIDIIIEGILPTLCHFNPSVSIAEKKSQNLIIVAKANLLNAHCVKTYIPFMKVLKLKNFQAGAYRLLFKNPSHHIPGLNLQIKPVPLLITPPINYIQDENIYANVESVYSLDKDTIAIRGTHPSDCFKLKEIKLIVDKSNILVVLPKMERDQNVSCLPQKLIPFEYNIDLREKNLDERTLIHIRSMSGQSHNLIHFF